MIEARDVVKTFVRQEKKGKKETFAAVDGISLKAGRGEVLGILGPNGAGKTTLLRMLGFLMEPVSGQVVLHDETGGEIRDAVVCKRHIGYLSENTKLYPRFSVRELLQFVGEVYGHPDAFIKKQIEEVTEVLQMERFLDNRIEKLSTGQKQRTSIARCLVADPDIYIMDEPTLGLDVVSAQSVTTFMKREKEKGKTVLYSTHYMEEAEQLCDQILIIQHGKVIAYGSPGELLKQTGTATLRDTFFSLIGDEEVVA